MIPAFLITLREVIEASLIVATILGILVKLKNKPGQKTVYWATGAAVLASIALLIGGSFLGYELQTLYSGKVEEFIEGTLMIISAIFITWAVFFLHTYFGRYKVRLLQKISHSLSSNEQKGLFILAFTAIFREGIEIVLFLSTIYLSSDPMSVMKGASGGLVFGLLISAAFFTASIRMPVYYTFRITSILLILFAAGMLGRGIHEFTELRLLPEMGSVTLSFMPDAASFVGGIIKSIFGITPQMNGLQVALHVGYIGVMLWLLFLRKKMSSLRALFSYVI